MTKVMTAKRRTVAGGLLAAPAALLGAGAPAPAAAAPAPPANGTAGQLEPGAGGWQPWVLASGSEVQPPPPPGEAAARAELAELRALAARRDAAALDEVAYWDAGAPGYRWNELASARGLPVPQRHPGLPDAGLAQRGRPRRHHRHLGGQVPLQPAPPGGGRSLPRHGPLDPGRAPRTPASAPAAAGAAAAVLGYLFPDDAGALVEQAAAAGRSRLVAGVAYPSDVAAGLDLGRAVGERVVAWARSDGSDAPWTGTVPEGPGLWRGASPVEPLAGTWRTWVLASGSELRPPPPPAPDSAQRAAELEEVRAYARDIGAAVPPTAPHWLEHPAGRPAPVPGAAPAGVQQLVYHYAPLVHLLWLPQLNRKLAESRLDANPPRAARAYAAVAVAGSRRGWSPAGTASTTTGRGGRCTSTRASPPCCPASPTRTTPAATPPWTRPPGRCWPPSSRGTPPSSAPARRRTPPRGSGRASTSPAGARRG